MFGPCLLLLRHAFHISLLKTSSTTHCNLPVLLSTQHVKLWHRKDFLFQFLALQATLSNYLLTSEPVNMNFIGKKEWNQSIANQMYIFMVYKLHFGPFSTKCNRKKWEKCTFKTISWNSSAEISHHRHYTFSALLINIIY